MTVSRTRIFLGRTLFRSVCLGVAALCTLLGATSGTQDAVANGDTRTIEVMQMHTKERVSVTFRRNGRYDQDGLEQLSWIMRDWRRDEATKMNPRLFDLLWEVHRSTGSRQPVRVVSAYRAPTTNAMLRRRSSAVAQSSQHMSGNAVDFYLSDVSADRIRAIGMRMQRGGVGYYPRANTPFIHLDVASVRHWPRMTRPQLVNMFPDQRTAHIPTDGKPLARFDEARREILAAGGMVMGETGTAVGQEGTGRRSLWAALFGGGGEESEEDMAEANYASSDNWVSPASPSSSPAPAPSVVASAPPPAPQQARIAPRIAPQIASPPLPVASGPPLALSPSRELASADTDTLAPPPVRVPPVRPALARSGQQLATAVGPERSTGEPAGPQFVWQRGPPGLPSEGTAKGDELQMQVSLPLPPRRPESVASVASALTAYAGSTVEGPKDALAQLGIGPTLSLRGGVSPVQEIGARVPAFLPPRRQVASLGTTGPVRQSPPQPPVTASISPRPVARNVIAIARDDGAALRSLFSSSVTAARTMAPTRITIARVRRDQPAPNGFVAVSGVGLAQEFSKEPMGEITTSAFAGPAVKPLRLRP